MADAFDIDDKRRMELTLQTRERIVSVLCKDGNIPEHKEDRAFLLQALDGIDRTVLGRAKVRSDDKAAQAQTNVNAILSEFLLQFNPNAPAAPREAPLVLETDKKLSLVPGQMAIGTQVLTAEDTQQTE